MKRKKYTTLEALRLMKKGKLLARGEGFMHPAGYYFSYSAHPEYKNLFYFTEHNGDGSVFCRKKDFTEEVLERKKKWIIVTKKDLIQLYCQKYTKGKEGVK